MKISIVIPVYNVEKYVVRCLNSILNQSFQDFEVILVNDASTDGSLKIVEKYAQSDKRFVVISHERNMGQMWTRKTGYSRAKGEYIIFCDSDDYLLPDALQVLYDEILSSGADIVVSDWIRYTPAGKSVVRKNKLSYGTDSNAVYKSLLVGELTHSLYAKIFSARLVQSFEYETREHQTNSEDGWLFYQIVSHVHKVMLLSVPTYCYVFNPNSATIRIDQNKVRQVFSFSSWRFGFLKSREGIYHENIMATILMRIRLLRYGFVHPNKMFPEKELQSVIGLKGLMNYFPITEAFASYLVIHCPIVSYFRHLKYILKVCLLEKM